MFSVQAYLIQTMRIPQTYVRHFYWKQVCNKSLYLTSRNHPGVIIGEISVSDLKQYYNIDTNEKYYLLSICGHDLTKVFDDSSPVKIDSNTEMSTKFIMLSESTMRENIDNNKVVFLRENELDDGQENKTINIMQKLASKLNFIDVKLYDKENEKFTQLNMNPNHCKLYRNIDEKALAFANITRIYIDVNTGDSFLIHDYAFRHIFAYMCLLKIKELNHIIEYNRLFIEYNNAFKIQSEIKTVIDNYKLKTKDSQNKNIQELPEYIE